LVKIDAVVEGPQQLGRVAAHSGDLESRAELELGDADAGGIQLFDACCRVFELDRGVAYVEANAKVPSQRVACLGRGRMRRTAKQLDRRGRE
jgi:hypothetical protein